MFNLNDLLPYLRSDFLVLDEYHKTLKNRLHDHLNHPFDKDFRDTAAGKEYVPLDQRKPLVKVPLGKQIVETVVSYTFGKGNFPKIAARTTKDVFTSASVPVVSQEGVRMDLVNAKLSKFVNQLVYKSFMPAVVMRAARLALSMNKCIVYFKYVDGKPEWEVLNWKWVQNEQYDPKDDKTLISFDYITFELGCDEAGAECIWWKKCRYDQQGEYTYAPVKHENGQKPKFTKIEKEVIHNLGICPGLVLVANPEDESIFESQVENIFQYTVYFNTVLVGIRKNMNPQRIWMGDTPPNTQDLIRANDSFWAMPEGKFLSDAPNPQAYQYALQEEHRLREIILRGCRTVEIPNENYQSGEALKMKIAPELNLVQETRTELGDKGLVEMLMLAVKVTCILASRENISVGEDGIEVVERNLLNLGSDISIPAVDMLNEIDLSLGWGEIFIPTAESKNLDIQTGVMAAKGDYQSGADPLFSDLTIRAAMSSHFNVTDMNNEQAQIEREKITRLNNLAITALIETASKSGNAELLLKVIEALSANSSAALPYEYNSSANFAAVAGYLAKAMDELEDEIEDETETEDMNGEEEEDAPDQQGTESD